MTQLDLYAMAARKAAEAARPAPSPVIPRHVVGSETSLEAARSMQRPSAQLRETVLRFVAGRGAHGATDDEIEEGLGMRHQSASARRNELAAAGQVVDSGLKRSTRSGRKATVWVARAAAGDVAWPGT